MNQYEVEAYIYDKKIGTLLLKDGTIYFEYDKYFEQLSGVFHDSLPGELPFGYRAKGFLTSRN